MNLYLSTDECACSRKHISAWCFGSFCEKILSAMKNGGWVFPVVNTSSFCFLPAGLSSVVIIQRIKQWLKVWKYTISFICLREPVILSDEREGPALCPQINTKHPLFIVDASVNNIYKLYRPLFAFYFYNALLCKYFTFLVPIFIIRVLCKKTKKIAIPYYIGRPFTCSRLQPVFFVVFGTAEKVYC